MQYILTEEELEEIRRAEHTEGYNEGYRNGKAEAKRKADERELELATAIYMLAKGDVKLEGPPPGSTRNRTSSISFPRPMVGSYRLRREENKETDTIKLWAE